MVKIRAEINEIETRKTTEIINEMNNFLKYLCILREREQGRGRESGRERIPSRLCAVSANPIVGLNLTMGSRPEPNQELNT